MTRHDADLYREEHPEEFDFDTPLPCPELTAEMTAVWDEAAWWLVQEAEALAALRDGEEDFPQGFPEAFTPRPCTPEDDLDIRIA